ERESRNFAEAERLLRDGLEILDGAKSSRGERDTETRRREYELEIQFRWSLGNLLMDRAFSDEPGDEPKNLLAEVAQIVKTLGKLRARPEFGLFLEARTDVGREDWHAAAEKFERVRLSLSSNPMVSHVADLALSECYQRMWNPDLRWRVFQ